MEMVSKENYIGTKFLVQEPKKLKSELTSKKGLFASFVLSFFAKDEIIKTYFDTDDRFFQQNGISINITRSAKDAELIVRYSSSTPRIAFLNSLPDTFVKKINRKDYIKEHLDFITQAVNELLPAGLNKDLSSILENIKPQISVNKKRERYRLLNNSGLKLILSLDEAEYSTYYSRGKQKISMCETILTSDSKTSREFFNFEHALSMQMPSIIKLAENDLAIAQTYLGSRK